MGSRDGTPVPPIHFNIVGLGLLYYEATVPVRYLSAYPVFVLQVTKNIVLQWGELPTSVAYIGTGQIMGWGNKAIEIRSVETGHLDGVFMHKKAQKLKFLCERNDKASAVQQALFCL